MLWKDHYIHTTLTHFHVLCTFMFHPQSGAHQGTFLCIYIPPSCILDFCFELSWRERLYVPISWSNKKFPVVTSRLLTVCPLCWQRDGEGHIRRRSCHTPISALMSDIKQCPYLNVILKGKTGRGVCVWKMYQKKTAHKDISTAFFVLLCRAVDKVYLFKNARCQDLL